MPLLLEQELANAKMLIWKVEESAAYYLENMSLGEEERTLFNAISFPAKQTEFLASRMAIKQLVPGAITFKDEYQKPHLKEQIGDVSIAHCKGFAAVMHSASHFVGIDIEPIHPKVDRVATKFLNEKELAFIDDEKRITHLIACWAIKEAVYKWYGKKSLSFKRDILIEPFLIETNPKETFVKLLSNSSVYNLKVHYQIIQNCILAYLIE